MNGRNVQQVVRTLAIAGVLGCVFAGAAGAETVSAIDPSARAGGMGGATTALGWGGTPDLWANPALAAVVPGVTVQASAQRLLPGLANDLRMRSTSVTFTIAGLSYSTSGRPFGETTLRELVPSFDGSPVVQWTEVLDSRGAAVSLASLADAIAALRGHHGAIGEWGDFAYGRRWKRSVPGGFFGAGSVSMRDEGWFARVVPLDPRRGADVPEGGLRLEFSLAHSVLDGEGTPGRPVSPPYALQHRDGAAAHVSWWGPSRGGAPGAAIADAFRGGGFGPPVDVTLAWERERAQRVAFRDVFGTEYPAGPGWTVNHYGLEATFFGLLTGRAGYIDDPSGEIRKPTYGFGACVPLGRGGEVRYDLGSVPQAYPKRVTRHEVAVRLDPVARWFGPRSSAATP